MHTTHGTTHGTTHDTTHGYHGLGQGVIGLVGHGADQGHATDRGTDGGLRDLEHGLERRDKV